MKGIPGAALMVVWAVLFVQAPAAQIEGGVFAAAQGRGIREVRFTTPQEAVYFALGSSQSRLLGEQSARLSLREAKFNWGPFLPAFSLSLSETDSASLSAGDSRNRSLQFSVSGDLFDGGARRRAYRMARLNSFYAQLETDSQRQVFIADILARYYQYLVQRRRAEIQEDLKAAAEKELVIMEKEVSLGLTLETDYLEYYISFIQIENETREAWLSLDSLLRQFKTVLELNEEAELVIADELSLRSGYFFYEPYQEKIWLLIRAQSSELRKQDLALDYARQEGEFQSRWYLPALRLQGGVSFSTSQPAFFPLSDPKYSVSVSVSFPNLTFLPLNLSNSYGFEQERLYNVSNSAEASLPINPAYAAQVDMARLSLGQNAAGRRQAEIALREQVYQIINSHDAGLRAAQTAEQSIVLWERRLEFSRLALESGEKKQIEYLEELINLAQIKIAHLENLVMAASAVQSLEVLARLPFGELEHVCSN
ncbi:MAG: TolC family protein [Spirochaetales bacterium]|jgi:outer membrane protein TolC|nr:TolC family protein [Spirochaetales bacterium]